MSGLTVGLRLALLVIKEKICCIRLSLPPNVFQNLLSLHQRKELQTPKSEAKLSVYPF